LQSTKAAFFDLTSGLFFNLSYLRWAFFLFLLFSFFSLIMATREHEIFQSVIHRLIQSLEIQRGHLRRLHLEPSQRSEFLKRHGETKRLLVEVYKQREDYMRIGVVEKTWPLDFRSLDGSSSSDGSPSSSIRPLKYPAWSFLNERVAVFMDQFGQLIERYEAQQQQQPTNRPKFLPLLCFFA